MPEKRLTREEYMAIQNYLIGTANTLVLTDLPTFIDQLEAADSIGAILDPTLYRKAATNLHTVRELAQAAMKLRDVRIRQWKETPIEKIRSLMEQQLKESGDNNQERR